jgi:hypothetical protein
VPSTLGECLMLHLRGGRKDVRLRNMESVLALLDETFSHELIA